MWSFEMMVLLSGLLPKPELETSVLSVWLVLAVDCISPLHAPASAIIFIMKLFPFAASTQLLWYG